jgi:hypothetical protein
MLILSLTIVFPSPVYQENPASARIPMALRIKKERLRANSVKKLL